MKTLAFRENQFHHLFECEEGALDIGSSSSSCIVVVFVLWFGGFLSPLEHKIGCDFHCIS